MEELLEQLISEHERQQRTRRMSPAIEATSPIVMRAYLDETVEWERAQGAPRG